MNLSNILRDALQEMPKGVLEDLMKAFLPPRVLKQMNESEDAMAWMRRAGFIQPGTSAEMAVITCWSYISSLRICIRQTANLNEPVGAYFIVEGEPMYEAKGISMMVAGIRAIKARVEAEGREWIEDLKRETLAMPGDVS